jgi:hypothetical protein
MLKEIWIYFKFRKLVKKFSNDDIIWTRQGLRVDWLCRIYTVVNLPPQVTLSPDLPKESWPSFVFESIKPINDYFRTIGLEEMMTVSLDPIDKTNQESYLVVYYFLFKKLTFWRFLLYLIVLPASAIYSTIHFWSEILKFLNP